MAKVTIGVGNYGEVKVRRPRKLTKTKFANAIAEAVTGTLNLVFTPPTGFHPVLGLKPREAIVVNKDYPTHRHFYRITSFGNTEYVAFQCSCGSSKLVVRKRFIGGT